MIISLVLIVCGWVYACCCALSVNVTGKGLSEGISHAYWMTIMGLAIEAVFSIYGGFPL